MTRDALVVGINGYPESTDLSKPARDAEAVAQLLETYGNFRVRRLPEANINGKLCINPDGVVSGDELEDVIATLFNPDGNDAQVPKTALLFFAGHGLRKVRGGITEGFLATSDSNPKEGFWGVSLQWLRRLLQKSPVQQQIIWLDCCHSGELHNFDEADPGNLGQGKDKCFIAACRPFELAYESLGGEHGVLTQFLLEGLDPRENPEGVITNYTLVDFIIKEKVKVRGISQEPIHRNSGYSIILTTRNIEQVSAIREGICPYRGLKYFDFTDEDAEYFYGRTERIDELIEKVKTNNFLAVLGPSGCGKSSLVRAGLLYKLKLGQNLSGSDLWKIYPPFTPGEQDKTPLQNLARVFEESILAGKEGLKRLVEATQAPRVVLVIDQFEEIFTLCPDDSERHRFFECLLGALEAAEGKLCLILVMRADFLGKCAEKEYFGLTEYINKNQYLVPTLTASELEESIEKPAQKVSLGVEKGLVKQMVDDVQGSPGSLPLLQYTLTVLWHQKTVTRLTLHEYNRLGGVKGALQKQANLFFENLSETEQKIAKRIFLELTQLGEGTEDTRRRVLKTELVTTEYSEEAIDNILQKLVEVRLVVADELQARGQADNKALTVIDIAHESLIRHWPQLKNWLEENREMLRRKRDIESDTRKWVGKNKPTDRNELILGINLNLAENFLQNYLQELSSNSLELIELSITSRNEEIREKEERARQEREYLKKNNRKLLGLFLTASSFAIVFALTAVVALYLRDLAEEREKIARSVQLASASSSTLNSDSTLSLLLALHAKFIKNTPQANLALWNAFKNNHERFHLDHNSEILYAEFDPNNSERLLTTSRDGSVKIWDFNNLKNPVILKGHQGAVTHGSFNPHDSNQVLTVSYDGTARIWNLDNLDRQIIFSKHKAPVNYGKFDPHQSGRIITVGSDNKAHIWETSNPEASIVLDGHQGNIWMVEFDPHNPNRILTVSSDATARVWNLDDIDNPVIFRGHQGDILYGRFDPKNPDRIITTSVDRTARVWDLNDPYNPLVLQGHSKSVNMADFDPQNKNRVLTVSQDGTARVWNLKNIEDFTVLNGHTESVTSGQFNPYNSHQILTTSEDGKAKVWTIQDNQKEAIEFASLNGHKSGINLGIFNPYKPGQVLTISKDTTARIWDIGDKNIFQLPRNQGTILYSQFSRVDDKELLIVNRDGVISSWDINKAAIQKQYNLNTGLDSLIYAEFYPQSSNKVGVLNSEGTFQGWNLENLDSPIAELAKGNDQPLVTKVDPQNNDNILAINDNGVVTIRNWKTPEKEPLVISVHPKEISSAEFNPKNSNHILTSSSDGIIRLWSLNDTFRPLLEIVSSSEPLWFTRFNYNNLNLLLAGGSDKISRVQTLDNSQAPVNLIGHQNIIVYGEFDPNNPERVLTASYDNTVRIWDLRMPNEPLIINNFDSEVIYAGFSPHDSNLVSILTADSQVKIYATGGNKLVHLALESLSRCLSYEEIKTYNFPGNMQTDTIYNYLGNNILLNKQRALPNCQ